MAFRTATARWNGTVQQGAGELALGSGAFKGGYSFQSRMQESPLTNPEELVAAAHAGCFTMALAASLSQKGLNPTQLDTTATVHLTRDDIGFVISGIDLVTEGVVPGMDQATFEQEAHAAEKTCPISRALAATPITLKSATLRDA